MNRCHKVSILFFIGELVFFAIGIFTGKVYAGTHNGGNLLCLDAYIGDLIWEYNLCPKHIYSSPAIAYGNVYIGSGTTGDLIVFGQPNEPPETPSKPNGPSEGIVGVEYIFNTSTIDPEGDYIYYLFDWGDGNNSGWIGAYGSGTTVNASHIWTEAGDYEIRAKAHDGRRESNWSNPLTIHIIEVNLPPDAPTITGEINGKKGTEYRIHIQCSRPR